MATDTPDGQETLGLLQQIEAGDPTALEKLLARHRGVIRRMVELRMDAKLRGRVDASDIVQEAHLEVAKRIEDFLQRKPMPFHLWLRQTAYQNLLRLRRFHVEAGRRTVEKETPIPDHSSVLLAHMIMGNDPAPDQKIIEQELTQRVNEALAEMSDIDREILLMRHFEELSNQQVAQLLELDTKTASKRYGRALLKLRKYLTAQ